MKLFPAAASDAENLAGLHASAFETPWSAGEIADLFAGPGLGGLIAADEAGAAAMILWRAVLDEAEILTLATSPRARRRGIASALVQAAADLLGQAGAKALFLEVAVDNAAAIGLYRGRGFSEAGRRRGYYRRGDGSRADALVMRRALNAG